MSEVRKFSDWMRQRRLDRLLVTVLFFTIAYLVGTYALHRVFGWRLQSWQEIVFWGFCMGVTFTLWPPRLGSRKPESR